MKILIIEPYYTGSHKSWSIGFKRNSSHSIKILSMKGHFWKWRMHGGAVTMANEFHSLNYKPDLILASDMLDLSTFVSLTKRETIGIPIVLYFHENQITYPWSKTDRDIMKNRDNHYGFINYTSALSADFILFNSNFHMNSFLNILPTFLKQFPDYNELETVNTIKQKSNVLYLGLDLGKFDKIKTKKTKTPLILWNHRWEYDKNPELFFSVLKKIRSKGLNFSLAIIGENFSNSPTIFDSAKKDFKNQIIKWGYLNSRKNYAEWLCKSDILPVTSNQEFFGASVMEAIYCNTWPILPKRLTYPELIPRDLHNTHLYQSEKELINKLTWALENLSSIRKNKLKFISKRFDWKNISPIFDKTLTEVKEKY